MRRISQLVWIAIAMLGSPANEAVGDETLRRLPGNPIISQGSSATLGNKINGPSVIRVPRWVKEPLGRFYLYFAHHKGRFIRLAYADEITGPWSVYERTIVSFRRSRMPTA